MVIPADNNRGVLVENTISYYSLSVDENCIVVLVGKPAKGMDGPIRE